MSDATPTSGTPHKPGNLRVKRIWIIGLVGLFLGGMIFWGTPDIRHQRLNQHIQAHLGRALGSLGPYGSLPKSDLGRYRIMGAIETAMSNWPFWYRKNVMPDKFAAIAARLDDNNGDDLKTFEGCCHLLVMCNDASPTFHDYPFVTELYEMQSDGTIPPLPVLKIP